MEECLSTNISCDMMKKSETLMEGRHHTQSPTLNGIKCTILFYVQQTRENGVTQQAKKLRLNSFVSMSLLLEVLFSETCNQRWNSEFQFLWIKLPQKSQNVWKLNYAWKHCLWKSEKQILWYITGKSLVMCTSLGWACGQSNKCVDRESLSLGGSFGKLFIHSEL